MYIFLDESGDLGFDFTKKGTPHNFIITILICYSHAAKNNINFAVKKTIKNKLNKKKKNNAKELHGTTTPLSIKQYFYNKAKFIPDWEIYSINFNKKLLYDKLKTIPDKHRLYNFLSREILKHIKLDNINSNVSLIIDKCKGKKEIKIFNQYIYNHLEAILPLNIPLSINHEHSHENTCLQAVDLFCWGINRKINLADEEWFSLYKDRVNFFDLSVKDIKKDGP